MIGQEGRQVSQGGRSSYPVKVLASIVSDPILEHIENALKVTDGEQGHIFLHDIQAQVFMPLIGQGERANSKLGLGAGGQELHRGVWVARGSWLGIKNDEARRAKAGPLGDAS